MKVINVTSHEITFAAECGGGSLPPAGEGAVVRLDESRVVTDEVVTAEGEVSPSIVYDLWFPDGDDPYPETPPPGKRVKGLPVVEKKWGESNLPPRRRGVGFVVSALVANAHPDRDDLYVPETRREADGRIVATALIRNSPPTAVNEHTAAVAADAYAQGVEAAIRILLRMPALNPYAVEGDERQARFALCADLREQIRAGAETTALGGGEYGPLYGFTYSGGIVSEYVARMRRAQEERE